MSSPKLRRFCTWLAIFVCLGSATSLRAAPTSSAAKKQTTAVDHKRGRPPAKPAATLPPKAAKTAEDRTARRQIAGGSTQEELRARATDPELSALRAAERVLFPRPLVGFRPGWSWGTEDSSAQADGLPPAVEALPSATLPDAVNAEWLRSLTLPNFPIKLDPLVVQYLRFYREVPEGRTIAQIWARKVGRYTVAMQEELARAGLPSDLVWLSLIESGHNPTIVSPAGAAGLWQFIPETGRIYGLTVDRWVDERLDPLRSTQAAARFLSDLYQRFGSWELAMAAYNMGHAGLLKSMRKYNSNDFWKLSQYEAGLPWETTLYVPKVFAIAIVMNNRRAFGLHEIDPDPAITFDTVYVNSGAPLAEVARASGIPLASLRAMNPQYMGDRVPPGPAASEKAGASKERWPVRVPSGTGERTSKALSPGSASGAGGGLKPYTVRFGDTLENIAAANGLTPERLADLNGMLLSEGVAPGTVLLVASGASAAVSSEPSEESTVVIPEQAYSVPGRKRVFYRVLRGDTLAAIANALEVTPDELVIWNELDPRAKLQAGMSLQAFVAPKTDLSRVRTLPGEARIMQVGSLEFLHHFEALNGRKRILVKAKQGDTLEKIGKRHGLSVGMMERINRCPRTRVLVPGEEVVVYAKSDVPAASLVSTRSGASPDAAGLAGGAWGQILANRPVSSAAPPRPELLPGAAARAQD